MTGQQLILLILLLNFDAEFLFTDTKSFSYEIRRGSWRILKKKFLLYCSNYPKDSKFFYTTNEKVIG